MVLENVRDCDFLCREIESAFILTECLVGRSAAALDRLSEKNLVSPLKCHDSTFADWVNRGESDGVRGFASVGLGDLLPGIVGNCGHFIGLHPQARKISQLLDVKVVKRLHFDAFKGR